MGTSNQGSDSHIRIDVANGITVVALTNTEDPSTETDTLTQQLMNMLWLTRSRTGGPMSRVSYWCAVGGTRPVDRRSNSWSRGCSRSAFNLGSCGP